MLFATFVKNNRRLSILPPGQKVRGGGGTEIIHTSVVGTWNVLQAAEEAGVKRVIITSSASVVGFTVFECVLIPPTYLPVNSSHPHRPTDPYGLSKKLC